MIQNRLNDKDKDIRGLKKQTSSLLNCAWEKGYVAGFDDGYKSGIQAEERPKGKWIFSGVEHTDDNPIDSDSYYCSVCKRSISTTLTRPTELFPFCHCLADMRGDVWNGKEWVKDEGDV